MSVISRSQRRQRVPLLESLEGRALLAVYKIRLSGRTVGEYLNEPFVAQLATFTATRGPSNPRLPGDPAAFQRVLSTNGFRATAEVVGGTGGEQAASICLSSNEAEAARGVMVVRWASTLRVESTQRVRIRVYAPDGRIPPGTPGVVSSIGVRRRDPSLTVDQGQFTFDAEGIPSNADYTLKLHWPEGNSGPTIGRGYDLGQHTAAQIRSTMRAAGIPENKIAFFVRGAGLRGAAASAFVNQYRNTTDPQIRAISRLTRAEQQSLFEAVYPGYLSAAQTRYTNATRNIRNAVAWDRLDEHIRTMLADVQFQFGTTMAALNRAAASNDIQDLIDAMEANNQIMQFERLNRGRLDYLKAAIGDSSC